MDKTEDTTYDITVIRPEIRESSIHMRNEGLPKKRLASVRKALLTLHTLELMAINIYKFQITREKSQLNLRLIAAMCNEMTHYQDFQLKLFEYSHTPSRVRSIMWIAGFVFGYSSSLLGRRMILRTALWAEKKAIHHYDKLLAEIDWDTDTRKVVEKARADETGHAARWQKMLQD